MQIVLTLRGVADKQGGHMNRREFSQLRKRQAKAIELFRKYVPGCEGAFIVRTSPTLNLRRARVIACD